VKNYIERLFDAAPQQTKIAILTIQKIVSKEGRKKGGRPPNGSRCQWTVLSSCLGRGTGLLAIHQCAVSASKCGKADKREKKSMALEGKGEDLTAPEKRRWRMVRGNE